MEVPIAMAPQVSGWHLYGIYFSLWHNDSASAYPTVRGGVVQGKTHALCLSDRMWQTYVPGYSGCSSHSITHPFQTQKQNPGILIFNILLLLYGRWQSVSCLPLGAGSHEVIVNVSWVSNLYSPQRREEKRREEFSPSNRHLHCISESPELTSC